MSKIIRLGKHIESTPFNAPQNINECITSLGGFIFKRVWISEGLFYSYLLQFS